ncbi:MAG: GNAT family N-acetyltransferase [Ruminococcus sp.]|nr:GNAT family N-acetyltransferase [Ruminococcus sp.]
MGAYDGDKCVGLAIMQHALMKYMYLYDLKVNRDHRGRQIGKMLINRSKNVALSEGYRGIYTQGQDNNLAACLFYLKNGFVIGGLDTHVYTGTSQEGKSDILFYLDADK